MNLEKILVEILCNANHGKGSLLDRDPSLKSALIRMLKSMYLYLNKMQPGFTSEDMKAYIYRVMFMMTIIMVPDYHKVKAAELRMDTGFQHAYNLIQPVFLDEDQAFLIAAMLRQVKDSDQFGVVVGMLKESVKEYI